MRNIPKAQFVTDLWQEGARLMAEGYLKIPPEVALVWADTGYGDMQDGGKVAAGQGAYFHVAMMNGQANQLSEMVPVGVIQEELGRYIKAGATSYVLVNTSDIRPVAMTARALMETAWGGAPGTARRRGRRLTTTAGRRRSSAPNPPKRSRRVYKEYFAAPAVRGSAPLPGLTSAGNAPPPPPPLSKIARPYGDQHYHSEIRRLILDALTEHQVIAVPSQSPKWTEPHVLPEPSAEIRAGADPTRH